MCLAGCQAICLGLFFFGGGGEATAFKMLIKIFTLVNFHIIVTSVPPLKSPELYTQDGGGGAKSSNADVSKWRTKVKKER